MTTLRKGVYVTNGGDADPPLCRPDAYGDRLVEIDLYEQARPGLSVALAPFAAALFPIHVDQRLLRVQQRELEIWLDRGGTLIINGHIAYPYLECLATFVPLIRTSLPDLEVVPLTPHPIFAGVAPEDLSFRRGVGGFYGRGHNPPPAGAVLLNGLGLERAPVDWLFQRPRGGRILMHSGNNIWMYHREQSSAARLVPQLLDWALGAP